MATDLTEELLDGYVKGTEKRISGSAYVNPYIPTSDAFNAWDIGYWLATRPNGGYPPPIRGSRGRGSARVRVTWESATFQNPASAVYERINATTIRRAD